MANIIDDISLLHKAVGHNQDSIDALNRLIEYSNTLEVKVGVLEKFVDGMQDAVGEQTDTFDYRIETLREDLDDAQQGVEDNYALLGGDEGFALLDDVGPSKTLGELLQTVRSLKEVDHNIVDENDETTFGFEHFLATVDNASDDDPTDLSNV